MTDIFTQGMREEKIQKRFGRHELVRINENEDD